VLLCIFRKQPAAPYPSHFLQKQKQPRPPPLMKQWVIMYDRDIVCLPKQFVSEGGQIRIPRSKRDREFLVANKLVGKIQLRSDMDEVKTATDFLRTNAVISF